jgi:hypothetical protein
MGVPTEFILKIKSGKERESTEGQMVINLIRVRNVIRRISIWPQMTK